MKIYTGGGDRGKTSLFSGERIAKSHDRVEAYGDIDELCSILGAVTASLAGKYPEVEAEIHGIQSDLMKVGALLSTSPDAPAFAELEKIEEGSVRTLEANMDRMDTDLPPLRGFILPGGDMSAAWAHIARTVCRRTERHVIALVDSFGGHGHRGDYLKVLAYMNRLSDYLFVLARYCNHLSDRSDILWKP
ncbi:MAG: cob(I)yrinic acid a,c-diamide adenosyltransferase [Thermodesulfobacteriota bacterium]